MAMRTFALVLLGLLWAGMAEAATYYTGKAGSDANSCATARTIGTPKLTITAGKDCLTTPGDTLIVRDGTYVEAEIPMTVNGTQANPITIQAEHALLAILSSISGCNPNISFYASWIVVDGLRSQVNAADIACGSGINSASGMFVRMWSGNIPSISGPTSTSYQGGVVRNCQIDASSHRGGGIKSNQDNSLVENCTIHAGLEAFNGNHQVFRNNLVDAPDAWGDLFTAKGGARNTQVYNNLFRMSSSVGRGLTLGGNSGCCWWDASTHFEGYNQVAYNNVVIADSGSGSGAMSMWGTKNSAFYNNIVIKGSLGLFPGSAPGFDPRPVPESPSIKNNISSCGGVVATQSLTATGTLSLNYNNFFNCSSPPTQVNAIVGDPLFVNPASDWHLQNGSLALNVGTPITMTGYNGETIVVNLDKVGVTRQVPWDLGIYAANGVATDVTPPAAPVSLSVR